MKKLVTFSFALFLGASLTGCSQTKTTDKVETTVTTPAGESKTTVETTVTKPVDDGPKADPLATPPDPLAAPANTGPKAADPNAELVDPLKPIK